MRRPACIRGHSLKLHGRRCLGNALMVIDSAKGAIVARNQDLTALYIDREDDHLRETRAGRLFETGPACQSAL